MVSTSVLSSSPNDTVVLHLVHWSQRQNVIANLVTRWSEESRTSGSALELVANGRESIEVTPHFDSHSARKHKNGSLPAEPTHEVGKFKRNVVPGRRVPPTTGHRFVVGRCDGNSEVS